MQEQGILKSIWFFIRGIMATLLMGVVAYLCKFILQALKTDAEPHLLEIVSFAIWAVLMVAVVIISKESFVESFRIFTPEFSVFPKKRPIYVILLMLTGVVFGITLNRLVTIAVDLLPVPETWVAANAESVGSAMSGNPVLMIIALYLVAPIWEELIFRGRAYWLFEKALPGRIGTYFAMILTSAVFAFLHGNNLQAVYAFLCGIVFCLIDLHTKTIFTSVAAHIGFNVSNILIAAVITGRDAATKTAVNVICMVILVISAVAIYIIGTLGTEKKEEEVSEDEYSIYR